MIFFVNFTFNTLMKIPLLSYNIIAKYLKIEINALQSKDLQFKLEDVIEMLNYIFEDSAVIDAFFYLYLDVNHKNITDDLNENYRNAYLYWLYLIINSLCDTMEIAARDTFNATNIQKYIEKLRLYRKHLIHKYIVI